MPLDKDGVIDGWHLSLAATELDYKEGRATTTKSATSAPAMSFRHRGAGVRTAHSFPLTK